MILPCGQTELQEFVHTVFFEGCHIVCSGNKRRAKLKEMERKNNELIKNTSYCNHRI